MPSRSEPSSSVPGGEIAEQPARPDGLLALDNRAILEEAAELRGQFVEISTKIMRLQLAARPPKYIAQSQDLPGERQLVGRVKRTVEAAADFPPALRKTD